jgi:hypothetical protein
VTLEGYPVKDTPSLESRCERRGRWIHANGYHPAGYDRELYLVYLECGDHREAWVTELQEPVATS